MAATDAAKSKTVVKSTGAVGTHSFLREEQVAFSEHINHSLGRDEYLTGRKVLPMNPEAGDIFRAVGDGILLCKLINLAQPETVDERALNLPAEGKSLNPWEMTENQNMVINSARAIGCQVVNIHASDLIKAADEHKEHLVLGLVWQIVKVQLLSQISIKEVPQLVALLAEGEDLATLMKLPPEEVLLRWIRHHLAKDGCARTVNNLHSDLKDSEVYLRLLHSIAPGSCPYEAGMAEADPAKRAEKVIENARAIDVPAFIQPGDIASGNRRLNLAFVAQIFNTHHGLDAKAEDLKAVEDLYTAAGLEEDGEESDNRREERVFTKWLNALNIGEKQVANLFDDLNDGLFLIDAINKVAPGTVDEKRVNRDQAKLNRFKKVENCNYGVQLGRGLGFSMPGTGGIDVAGGNKKLVLGFVWQLMRLQTVKMLQEVGGGTVPKDSDIIAWANSTVSAAGREGSISSFKDASLGSGVFLLNLLGAVEPRAINPAIPTAGETDGDRAKNAKYVIAVARKIGAQVFCGWEDIRDVKQKMIMTLVGSIMHTAQSRTAAKPAGAAVGGAGSA